jgi:hypothetical protein
MRIITTLLATAALLAATTTGCKKPDEISTTIEIVSNDAKFDGQTLSFDWVRQTAILEVLTETATARWNAAIPTNDIWCSYTRQGNRVIISVTENTSRQPRTTFIRFSLGGKSHRIEIYQHGMLFLELEETNIVLSSAATNVSIPLITNITTDSLTVRPDNPADWIRGLVVDTNHNVVFAVTRNTTGTERQATLTISGEGRTVSTTVTQYPQGIILSDNTYNVCPEPFVTLSVEIDDASFLQWYRNSDLIADATGPTFIATQSGTYTVSVDGHMSPEREIIMTHCINVDALIYEDFIGTYTMWFHNNTSTPPPAGTAGAPRQFHTTVTLEPAIWGETYYLRGILSPADEALGSILVKYNPETMCIEIWGQKLFERESGARPSFWLSPEGVAATRARSNPTNAQGRGVTSTNHDISNGLRFELNHNGAISWTNTTATGFHLMNFTSDTDATNGTDVAGLSPIPSDGRFNHLLFERNLTAEPPCEHNYLFTSTTAPTCAAEGYDLYTCSLCDKTEQRNLVTALAAPQNLAINSNTLTWNTVANATGYMVDINGTEHPVATTTFNLSILTEPNTYTIKVRAEGGNDTTLIDMECWSATIQHVVTPTNISITVDDNGIRLFPNPVEDVLTLEVGNATPSMIYRIFDITGRLVTTGQVVQPQTRIDMQNFQQGAYILTVEYSGMQVQSFRIVKN